MSFHSYLCGNLLWQSCLTFFLHSIIVRAVSLMATLCSLLYMPNCQHRVTLQLPAIAPLRDASNTIAPLAPFRSAHRVQQTSPLWPVIPLNPRKSLSPSAITSFNSSVVKNHFSVRIPTTHFPRTSTAFFPRNGQSGLSKNVSLKKCDSRISFSNA